MNYQEGGSVTTPPLAGPTGYGSTVHVKTPPAGTPIPPGAVIRGDIMSYKVGVDPQLSYRPDQHSDWLTNVAQQAGTIATGFTNQASGGGGTSTGGGGSSGGGGGSAATTGLDSYTDDPGTWTSTAGLGTLQHDELAQAPDNYTNIPSSGEAFTTTFTGTDSQGNQYSQPVVVVDSSNPGTLSESYAPNYGSVSPSTLGTVDYNIPGIVGNAVNTVTGGYTPTELSSTGQLGQHSSVSHGDSWVKQSDGTYSQEGSSGSSSGGGGLFGFTSIGDAFDGGGPGQSGDTYSGGIHNVLSKDDDDDDDNDSGSSGSSGGYSCYVATALNEAGLWSDIKRLKLISWCMKAKPEDKLDTKIWRNGYCIFGKNVIAPHVDNKAIQWLSNGFYKSTVKKETSIQSLLGKAFFYVPSYVIGTYKMLTGNLKEIKRT